MLSWLMISPLSPVRSSFEGLTEFFSIAQICATFLAILLSGNVHGGTNAGIIYWLLVFVQWSGIGWGISALVRASTPK